MPRQTTAVYWLNDRTDERVQRALQRHCGICAAQPGADCTNSWDHKPLPGRIIHESRLAKQDFRRVEDI